MGEYADIAIEQEMRNMACANDSDLDEWYNGTKAKKKTKNIMWTQRGGKKINIKDMTDEHLLNVISLVKRRNPSHWILSHLTKESKDRL